MDRRLAYAPPLVLLLAAAAAVALYGKANRNADGLEAAVAGIAAAAATTTTTTTTTLGAVPADAWHSSEADDDAETGEATGAQQRQQQQQQQSSACRCWSASDEAGSYFEIECKCRGRRVASVPPTLPADVHRITLFDCGLERLRNGELQTYNATLTDFVLDKAPRLVAIEEKAFHGLGKLQRIYLRRAALLVSLPPGLFAVSLPSLHILLIKQTGLRVFPDLSGLETVNILHTVDLEENQLEVIASNSVKLRADDFLVSDNLIHTVEAAAFNGSQIATLRLKRNRRLDKLHADAFVGLTSLRRLDLSQTAITSLPTRGLAELEILELTETRSLKEIPSVYNYQGMIAEMQAKYCNGSADDANGDPLLDDDCAGSGTDVSVRNCPEDGEYFHPDPFQTPNNRQLFFHAFCGNLTHAKRQVNCTPQPDAFNPCEDILGATWLRVAAWLVSVASVVGNLAVVLVLLQSSRCPMAVSKFLMVNLAIADLCMGCYLFLIVGMDVNTIGVYFNYAIDWQNGIGCKIAGFLTVFATELSVFTLVVITSERWYTITYAINLTRRLRLSTTAKIVAAGWIGSLVVASLPLAGISSFSTTSICLPLENHNLSDTIYLLLLLILNGVAFLFICLCYSHMYRSISGHHQSLASHSDATVAKRMALLVFTNLACWTPIAFFGLTAVAGYPLISVTHSKILLVFFYPLNACTNPYLYALITKQYRRDFFMLLGRYGFCTERASRYRTTFSFGRGNNPIRAGSQLESAMQAGHTSSPHSGINSESKIPRIKTTYSEGKRGSTPSGSLYRSSRCEGKTEQSDIELVPLSVANAPAPSGSQQPAVKTLLAVKSDDPSKPPNRLSLVLELESCSGGDSESGVQQYHGANGETRHQPVVVVASIDSPHPIKHCQLRSIGGKDRVTLMDSSGLPDFILQSEGKL